MKINEVKKALPFLLKHNIRPMLWGSNGVGKTETVKQYPKENNLGIVVLNTATQEVGDLVGLLVKNDKDKTAYHTRPEWFPTEKTHPEGGIVFLDELNRAQPDVIQALFPFILSGTLHTHQLPANWKVVAAGNYANERFNTTDVSDAAFLSRFCHIDFTPSLEEWLMYAENLGLEDTAAFLREQPSMLELSAKEAGRMDTSFVTPDRRSWLNGVGSLEKDPEFPDELRFEVYCGLVGTAAASAFTAWKSKKERALTLNDVVSRYSKVRTRVKEISGKKGETRFDLLNQPIDELMTRLEGSPEYLSAAGYLTNLKTFLTDIPLELAMKAFSRFHEIKEFHGRGELLNDPAFVMQFKAS